MDLGLTDRVVLISGGYRGTGGGTARVFAAEGARVAVHGFEPGQADEVVSGIVSAGGRAVGVHGDLFTTAGAESCVDQVEAAFGPVEVLVNNYGAPGDTRWSTPADEWTDGWDRNVLTAIRLTQRVLPGMRERGWGRIVFLATIGTARPGDRNPDYYGAKTGLHAIARSLAKELRGTGITANVVSPGLIATAEVLEMLERRRDRDGSFMPNLADRIAAPEDIGRIVAFVASEAGWHLNAADIRADGGALDA